jgi:rhomboid family GlyGly-CTERM serine protease
MPALDAAMAAEPWRQRLLRLGWPPPAYLVTAALAWLIQLNPAWREVLIYERGAVGGGEIWRWWTGHLVHFGWPHFLADTGLLLLIGWALGRQFPRASLLGLLLQPVLITAVIFWWDPTMTRYAGLSAVNLGLLLLLAARGWQGNPRDWLWPAIVVLYVAELGFEITRGGQGGGFIVFDDPDVKVATRAHLAAAGYALLAWGWTRWCWDRSTRRSLSGP